MTAFPESVRRQFSTAVQAASSRREVIDAVANVYRAVQDQTDLRRPVCTTSGRCCRFEEFGHRLFVTTMEMAAFLHEREAELSHVEPTRDTRRIVGGGCPFQREKLCTVHAIRPFGCRVFFCDETSTEWQHRQYEFFHAELRRLHDRLEVPYFYLEWRQALQAIRAETGSGNSRESGVHQGVARGGDSL